MKRIRSQEYLASQRIRKARRYLERREFALAELGGKCVKCGSTDSLEIDHISREDKAFAISRPPNEKAFKEELKKCQLLCYPCHRTKSTEEQRGEGNPCAKLSVVKVIEIRKRLLSGETGRSLAKQFGVDPNQISRIKTGKRWKHANS